MATISHGDIDADITDAVNYHDDSPEKDSSKLIEEDPDDELLPDFGEGDVAGVPQHPQRACSFRELFSLASCTDRCYLALGVLGAGISGFWPSICNVTLASIAGELALAMETRDYESMMENSLEGARYMALFATAWLLTGSLQAFGFKTFRERQISKMRYIYFQCILYQDLAWFDGESIASLAVQMSSDIDTISDGFGDRLSQMVMAVSANIAGFTISFMLGWQVTLVMCATLPPLALAQAACSKIVSAVHNETQGHYAQAAECVEECLYATKTVISLGYEWSAISRFSQVMELVRKAGVRKTIKQGLLLGFNYVAQIGSYVACFWYGARCLRDGIRRGDGQLYEGKQIIGIFLCIFGCSMMLGMLDPGISGIRKACVSAGRLFELRDKPELINRKGKDDRKALRYMDSIVFDDVFFSYPTRPDAKILHGVSLEIKKGQKVAFVGASGCGKSTLVCLLERFYDPTKGQVLVNGKDLKIYSISTVRQVMGYVGQEPVIFHGSVKDNVLRGSPNATRDEIEEALENAECWFIKNLPDRLETAVGTSGSQFSGGQKQRLAIARALLKKPSVLLLDEATSALDNRAERLIQGTLDKHADNRGAHLTMISIAHRLSSIRNSDCIYMFVHGAMLEHGTHRELMILQGRYHELAESQAAAMIQPDNSDSSSEDPDDDDVNEDPDDTVGFTDFMEEKGAGIASASRNTRILRDWSTSTAVRTMALEGSRTRVFASRSAASQSKIMSGDAPQRSKTTTMATTLLDGTVKPANNYKEHKEQEQQANPKPYKAPMSRFLSFNKPEWWCIPISCLGALATGGCYPLIGILIIEANQAFYLTNLDDMYDEILRICVSYLVIMCVMYVGCTVQFSSCGYMGEAMIKRMRIDIFTHILRQEVGFYDDPQNTPAQLGQNLQQWAYRISTLTDAICVNFATLGSIAIGLGASLYYCWPVCIAMSFCFPIVIICQFLASLYGGYGAGHTHIPETVQTLISEAVQNPKTVQALCLQQEMLSDYRNDVDPYKGISAKAKFIKIFTSCLIFGLTNSVMMYILTINYWFTTFLIKEEFASYLDTNRALFSVYYAAVGAGVAAICLGDSGKAHQAAQEMFALLDRKPKIDGLEPDGITPPSNFKPGNIEFKGVVFSYPFRSKVQVLKGMNFVVKAGQSVGLVGPSGGGKSTMYAMMQRFYDPQEGQVLVGVEKMNLADLNIRWWRSQIGFVGQEPILFNTTVKQNVLYGAADGMRVTQAQLDKCAEMSHLGFLFEGHGQGWDTEVGPKGSRLSGGQKQRVAICRALVKNPPLLLLDEATSALDNVSERIVSKALEIARESRTSFSIAHRLSTVEECDIILVSSDGKIVESGKDAELMLKGGVYMKLQEAQGKESFCCA